jgi:hypothetical protein
MSSPAKRNRATDERLCDKDINIPLSTPHEFRDNNEARARLRCNIEEKAINFFKSKNLKHEQVITTAPSTVNDRTAAARN